MKSMRLALFQMQKRKTESISMILLVMISMILLSSGFSNLVDIQKIYGNVVEERHGIRNAIQIDKPDYHDFYDSFLESDERVTRFQNIEAGASISSKFIDKNGEEASQYMMIFNRESEEKMEDFIVDSSVSKEELQSMAHPVYAPYYVKDTLGFQEKDTFVLILNGKQYPFTIAGFFESCLFADNISFVKLVVNDEDYKVLSAITTKEYILGFDTADDQEAIHVASDFLKYVDDNTSKGEALNFSTWLFRNNEIISGQFVKLMLIVMMVMSMVVLISVLLMIRHQIADDIQEQIVSIGVLEAMGYRSGEITLSYALSYSMLGTCGIVLGILGARVLSPILFHVGERMSGHHGKASIHLGSDLLFALVLVGIIIGIALWKAGMIKKYPPVVAFRKGSKDHHFKKDFLPLERTKSNVHVRIAMKSFFNNSMKNIGVCVCVAISSFAIIVCFIFFDFFMKGTHAMDAIIGMEMPELRVTVTQGTDVEQLREALMQDARVEKIVITSDWFHMKLSHDDIGFFPVVYDDFRETEKIRPMEGRLPKHDNEVMITGIVSSMEGFSVGDTLSVQIGNVEKNYLICGIVTSMGNGGTNLYMTTEGIKRVMPYYQPTVLEISLKEGEDYKAFDAWLAENFGRSINDAMEDDCDGETAEERLQKEAEKRMAKLLALYGISHVEYAITTGDTKIKGSSSIFQIENTISLKEILETQVGGMVRALQLSTAIFMLIATLVIMIIMFIIMSSGVKKQRGELGIFKGLGYTSKELMLQLSFRMVPVLVMGILLGSILAIGSVNVFMVFFVGKVEYHALNIILVDFMILGFAWLSALVGAGKIRKISVYELMSE